MKTGHALDESPISLLSEIDVDIGPAGSTSTYFRYIP